MKKYLPLFVMAMLVAAGCTNSSSTMGNENVPPKNNNTNVTTNTNTSEETINTNTENTTTVYLVALEDAGKSGKEIGCGDSVVPVEVQLNSKDAEEDVTHNIENALEALLAIDEQNYGQSGLYNALYNNDLKISSIEGTNDTGMAIYLTGTVSLGGTCDTPRVEAQLEETVKTAGLQVETVEIYLNDELLKDALSTK